jgi:CHAT domain-containing protein
MPYYRIILKLGNALICKVASKSFSVFVLTAILLLTFTSLLWAQGTGGRSNRLSPQAASQAEELFQSALLLLDKQEDDSARVQMQEAMRLWEQLGVSEKAAKAALQMGRRYKQIRKYKEALNSFHQALTVKELPNAIRVDVLNAIALIYAELYIHNLARYYFNEALDQARIINDLPAQIFALSGLAELYYQKGEKAQALLCITRTQQLNQQRDVDTKASLLYLLGQIRREEGLLERAKSIFEEALAIYGKTGNVTGQVKTLCAISKLSLLAMQQQVAFKHADQAVELAENQAKRAISEADHVNAHELCWRAWFSRARAERALGQKESATTSYSRAINHFEAKWWTVYIATEDSAIASKEEIQEAYREYVDILMEQKEFNWAYELADKSKSRTLLNFTGARRATQSSEDNKQTAAAHELSQSIARLKRQTQLPKQIEKIEYLIQESQVQIEMERAKERMKWSKLVKADQLQKQMAQDQTTLVEFFLGEEHSFVWLFTEEGVYQETLPSRKEIEEWVRPYLTTLSAAPSRMYPEKALSKLRGQSETLFAKLFGGLTKHLKSGQPLIVVPDGLLHYLPFETLIYDGHYLIEDREIIYNPSASMLALLKASESTIKNPDKMELLAIGDVIFAPPAKAIKGKKSSNGLSNQALPETQNVNLSSLPNTRTEVEDIASFFPVDRRKTLMGKESTESAFKRESLRRYRRLHFATHSLINETSPMQSVVVLTQGDDPQEDGRLDAGEISRLDLDCDLVVVSACQTGRGKLLSGEGVVGLSRAFLYAGAQSVVVSLWNVSDGSTSQLMKVFYQNLTAGQSKAAALRKAKLQMIGNSNLTRHPYYWAPFIMIGKP